MKVEENLCDSCIHQDPTTKKCTHPMSAIMGDLDITLACVKYKRRV